MYSVTFNFIIQTAPTDLQEFGRFGSVTLGITEGSVYELPFRICQDHSRAWYLGIRSFRCTQYPFWKILRMNCPSGCGQNQAFDEVT